MPPEGAEDLREDVEQHLHVLKIFYYRVAGSTSIGRERYELSLGDGGRLAEVAANRPKPRKLGTLERYRSLRHCL
jgi:hypothetical protein